MIVALKSVNRRSDQQQLKCLVALPAYETRKESWCTGQTWSEYPKGWLIDKVVEGSDMP
jgi:hypothetical protein